MLADNSASSSEEKNDTEDIGHGEGIASLLRSHSEYGSNYHLENPDKFRRSTSHSSPRVLKEYNSQEIVDCDKDEGSHILRDVSSFISSISQFYDNDSLSDVVIRIGPSTYKAHKFILAKSSRVFRAMLYSEEWNSRSSSTSRLGDELNRRGGNLSNSKKCVDLELEETPECHAVFDKFLKFLYSGEVLIDSLTAIGILCLADKYDVTSLKDLCVLYMVEWSKSPRVHNALSWYGWAKLINLEPLLQQCTKTISWNFTDVVSSDEWVRMDVDFLIDMLSSSELVVQNEYVIYEAVVSWLFAEHNRPELDRHVQMLFPLVRFPQLHVSQLYQIEKSHLYSMPECSKVISELASKAYRFRAVCPTQAHLGVCFDEEFFFPRDYTYLIVDQVRIQNTLRFGIQADVKVARSPVPCEVKEADWKITYRKQGEIWSLQLYCHDTALLNGETHVQPTVLVLNDKDKVIQVHREDKKIFIRGSTITIQVIICQPELAKSMAMLIKPIAF